MKNLRTLTCSAVVFLAIFAGLSFAAQDKTDDGEIYLIVRGDDIGFCHAANVGCIKSYREGIMRSVEVMVPCPWLPEAVKMLNENPGLDVGVHLTLTSEWELYKWGPLLPITEVPSIVNKEGYFYQMTREWDRWPPGTGFWDAKPKVEEVEKELRAQIELAMKKIHNVTHLTTHMGTARCTPELEALVKRLAKEYKLDISPAEYGVGRGGRWGGRSAELKEKSLIKLLENLKPGRWMIVEHPGMDTPEMRVIGHEGYNNVGVDRDGVTKAFTSEKVKEVIKRRGIKLISYGDLKREGK